MPKPTPRCLPSSLVATREQLEQLTEGEREVLRKYRDPEPKKDSGTGATEGPDTNPDSSWFIDTPEVRKILGIPW